jgi:hypothetical protein
MRFILSVGVGNYNFSAVGYFDPWDSFFTRVPFSISVFVMKHEALSVLMWLRLVGRLVGRMFVVSKRCVSQDGKS